MNASKRCLRAPFPNVPARLVGSREARTALQGGKPDRAGLFAFWRQQVMAETKRESLLAEIVHLAVSVTTEQLTVMRDAASWWVSGEVDEPDLRFVPAVEGGAA